MLSLEQNCSDPLCAHQYALVLQLHQSRLRVNAAPNTLIHSKDMWPLVIYSAHLFRNCLILAVTQRRYEL